MYDSNLVQKPSILVLNKMDTENANSKYDQFMEQFDNYESKIKISSIFIYRIFFFVLRFDNKN